MNIKDYPDLINAQDIDWLLVQENSTIPAYKKIQVVNLVKSRYNPNSGWVFKDGSMSYIAQDGDKLIVSSTGGTNPISLPSNPSFGTEIEILGAAGVNVNNIYIDGLFTFEGKQVYNLIVNKLYRSSKLVYIDSIIGWVQNPIGILTPNYPSVELNYASGGDTNGVFYYIGTNKLTEPWANPYTTGKINVFLSSAFSASHNNPQYLVSRQPESMLATADIPNSWIAVDLLTDKQLKITAYSIRGRSQDNGNPNNWKFQGSNDNNTWVDIDTQNNKNIQNNEWFTSTVSNQTEAYRYFRILQTGYNTVGYYFLTLGELELYGELTYNNG